MVFLMHVGAHCLFNMSTRYSPVGLIACPNLCDDPLGDCCEHDTCMLLLLLLLLCSHGAHFEDHSLYWGHDGSGDDYDDDGDG